MLRATFSITIVLSLVCLIVACSSPKQEALRELEYILVDVYPSCEQAVTQQTQEFRLFAAHFDSADSTGYSSRLKQIEKLRLNAIHELKSGIKLLDIPSEIGEHSILKKATMTYFRELLEFENELGPILQDLEGEYAPSAMYASLQELSKRHDIKVKGEIFIEKQLDFITKFNIHQHEIDKLKARN